MAETPLHVHLGDTVYCCDTPRASGDLTSHAASIPSSRRRLRLSAGVSALSSPRSTASSRRRSISAASRSSDFRTILSLTRPTRAEGDSVAPGVAAWLMMFATLDLRGGRAVRGLTAGAP
jgi:hypothetical protein